MKRWFNSAFPAFLVKTIEGYGFAIALSLVLHIIIFGVLIVNWSSDSSVKINPPMPISAALVELPKPVAKPTAVRKPIQGQADKKRKEEAKKQAEVKKKAEAKEKTEQQKKEQELQKALTLKREEEKKKEALRKKEEAARERQEQERQRLEREQQRKDQEALEQALALEQQTLKEAQQLEHDQLEQAKYAALIKSVTSQHWNRPPSARNNMVAEIKIRLSPFGDVLDISMITKSGYEEFDQSVIQAIELASPFSGLKDLERRIFYKYFQEITFRFRPEDLVK